MKSYERIFNWAIIIVMALYILFLQMCSGKRSNRGDDMCNCTIVDIDIQKKPRFFPVYKPYPVEIIIPGEITIDSIPYTDSSYCKQLAIDHYTEKQYKDTLKDDTIDIYIEETVKKNEIQKRIVGYKINKPFITVVNDRFQVFLTGNIGLQTDTLANFRFVAGPELILKDKRGFIYKAGVDFNTSGDIIYRVGAGFLIRFKKRLR